MVPADFSRREFRWGGLAFPVLETGDGPALIVMHELGGPNAFFIDFVRKLVAHGYRISLPVFFGTPDRPPGRFDSLVNLGRLCIRREFAALHAGDSGQVSDWVRALARTLQTDQGPVAVLGMCFSASIALAALIEPALTTAVLSQPSLPAGKSPIKRADLHLTDNECKRLAQRAADREIEALALRFTHDGLCPEERIGALRELLGEQVQCLAIDSSPGNRHGIRPRAHSVLTREFVDQPGHPTREAWERVVEFLDLRMKGPHPR